MSQEIDVVDLPRGPGLLSHKINLIERAAIAPIMQSRNMSFRSIAHCSLAIILGEKNQAHEGDRQRLFYGCLVSSIDCCKY